MKRAFRIVPFILFILVIDRFMLMPARMDGIWQYEKGTYSGDTVAFDNIQVINNFEIQIVKSSKFDSFYVLGCYFGNLYLLDKTYLRYTKYTRLEEIRIID